jgi:hypothetical protein
LLLLLPSNHWAFHQKGSAYGAAFFI